MIVESQVLVNAHERALQTVLYRSEDKVVLLRWYSLSSSHEYRLKENTGQVQTTVKCFSLKPSVADEINTGPSCDLAGPPGQGHEDLVGFDGIHSILPSEHLRQISAIDLTKITPCFLWDKEPFREFSEDILDI